MFHLVTLEAYIEYFLIIIHYVVCSLLYTFCVLFSTIKKGLQQKNIVDNCWALNVSNIWGELLGFITDVGNEADGMNISQFLIHRPYVISLLNLHFYDY